MGTKSKKQHLIAIGDRYPRLGRRFKTEILDEFCSVRWYGRQCAIRLWGRRPGPRRKRRPRPERPESNDWRVSCSPSAECRLWDSRGL